MSPRHRPAVNGPGESEKSRGSHGPTGPPRTHNGFESTVGLYAPSNPQVQQENRNITKQRNWGGSPLSTLFELFSSGRHQRGDCCFLKSANSFLVLRGRVVAGPID